MQKQSTGRLSMRNFIAVIIVMHVSNTIVLGSPTNVGTDGWVAYLMSVVVVIPWMMMYARLIHLMPGQDIFQMMEFTFGKKASIVISAFYAFYFITRSSTVRNYYADFVHQVALINTAVIVILFSFFVVCAYLAKSGTETMGKWSTFIMVLTTLITIALLLLSIPKYDVRNIMPIIGGNSFKDLAYTSVQFLLLPIGETIILLSMSGDLERKANPYKTFVLGGLITIAFFVVTFLRNLAVLGERMVEASNYASYQAASVVHIGTIGTRIESLIAVTFILTGITKVAACLYAGSKAVKQVFRLEEHNQFLLSVGYFSVALSVIIFYNSIDTFDFLNTFRIYSLPFHTLIPMAIWITAEIKMRRRKIPIQAVWKEDAAAKAHTS